MPANPDDLAVLARIAEPFEGDAPTGSDLRNDPAPRSPYSRLRDARAEARAEERASDNDVSAEVRPPRGWIEVEALASEVLQEQSKDIEIACWLCESLVRRRGLAGLALGATLIASLVRQFWSAGLHPPAEPGDPEARLFAVTGLSGAERDGSLMQPLRKIVLFEASDGAPIALWQYDRSRSVASLPEAARKQQTEKARVIPFDAVEVAARGAGRTTLIETARAALAAAEAWSALEAALAEVEPDNTPSTGRVASLLAGILEIATRYVPQNEWRPAPGAPPPEPDPGAGGGASDTSAATGDASPVPIGDDRSSSTVPAAPRPPTRDELLDEILRIAVLFRESEPNSPLGYTLEEAVRRARLPLHDLLREILPELPSRSSVLTILGIRPPVE